MPTFVAPFCETDLSEELIHMECHPISYSLFFSMDARISLPKEGEASPWRGAKALT